MQEVPFLGVGLSFRKELKEGILANPDRVDFLELIADQYVDQPPFRELEANELAQKFPLVIHGVDLSIGTDYPVDTDYLKKIRKLADSTQAKWVSDHLSLTRVPGNRLGQLTPLPFSEETVKLVTRHVQDVQEILACPFLLENITYYFVVPPSTMTEAQFVTEIVRDSGCWLLLDLTNLLNNAVNHKYDAFEFLDQIPLDRVVQIHLAGSSYSRKLWLDTHNRPVPADVLKLLEYAAPKMPMLKAVNIERDQDFPAIEELFAELDRVRQILARNRVPNNFATATVSPAPEISLDSTRCNP